MQDNLIEPKVVIMMATYNGEKYIRQQIESILKQTYLNWELFISDDGSTDSTVEILKKYRNKDIRIKNILVNSDEHGAFTNFYNVMRFVKKNVKTNFDYFFYSDQDDIWAREKIEIEVKKLQEEEQKFGNTPILCYSDLRLMCANGELTNILLSAHTHIQLENPYNIFFSHRYIWGTTMAHNKLLWNLLNIEISISNTISHDNYIGKYAATYGKIVYIDKSLVSYRRHGKNVSGVPHSYSLFEGVKRILTQLPMVIENHAKTYYATLFFIKNTTKVTPFLIELEGCLESGGYKAWKFVKKYKICTSKNFFNRVAFRLILYTGVYRLSSCFKHDYR